MGEEEFNLTNGGMNVRQLGSALPADRVRELWDLAQDYKNGELATPLHQRDTTAWSKKRKEAWIARLARVVDSGGAPPLGTICTYTLEGDAKHIEYINDGLQRISTSAHAIINPSEYGLTGDAVKRIFKTIAIPKQARIYKNHKEAADDFCLVNDGTSLEPGERHRYLLVYADGWAIVWEPQIKLWANAVQNGLARFCKSTGFRKQRIAGERSNLHLFAIAHRRRPFNYGSGPELEHQVVKSFAESSPEIVRNHIRATKQFIADIESAWRATVNSYADVMQESLGRWCLGVRLLYQDETSPMFWCEFFEKLFQRTGRHAKFIYKLREGKADNLTKRLDLFPYVCTDLGIAVPKKPERIRPKRMVQEGYHLDHPQSFVDHGEVASEDLLSPLPARQNMAKNARQ